MADSMQSEALAQFLSTVGDVDHNTAVNCLEDAGWDVGVAVETYYNHLEDNKSEPSAPKRGQGVWPSASKVSSKPTSSGGIRTFGEISKQPEAPEEEGQDMFAGGEKSGTAVRYPGLPDNVGSMLDGLFSRVNKPRPADEEDEEENEEEPKPKSKFSGSGMRLGETAVSEASETAPGSFSNQTIPSSSRNQVVVRNLTLWSNGLTLEDGPLMSYDSPEGRQFMEAVSRGMAPLDLLGAEQGQKVDVHVHRKLEEEYKAPPAALRPFSGTGNRLGSIVPSQISSQQKSAETPVKAPEHAVDPNKPQTSLQIRLADGTRLVARFNLDNTIADIRNFIDCSVPNGQTNNYIIQTSFPVKVLDDPSQTLEQAKLSNAVIMQRKV
ncbi:protein phosphatase regulator [Entomophthora muscae]|uniref:Protein phosphatase regulator n=1 Tax=Entomophthora muscae TaxID=34485 RepID=A0ACC2UB11_9FUNG|nr:protein phosphatase regulator [Entomophthora muscae]